MTVPVAKTTQKTHMEQMGFIACLMQGDSLPRRTAELPPTAVRDSAQDWGALGGSEEVGHFFRLQVLREQDRSPVGKS